MMDKREKKLLRRGIGSYTWALLIYYVVLNLCVSMVAQIELVYRGFQGAIRQNSWDAFLYTMERVVNDVFYGNGWGYLLACLIAVLGIRLWKGNVFFRDIFHTEKGMTAGAFWKLLCIFISGQLVFQVIAFIEEWLLNLVGLSVVESMEMASASADTFSMFLYMVLGAPIVEEIIFRGMVMRGLEPYGKRFAIVASAALFGLFHGNLVQTPYAFAVGLVLGYAAMEYSIGWAMVLHMINNLVLGDMFTRLTSFMDPNLSGYLLWGLFIICSIVSTFVLIRERHLIREYHRSDPINRNYAKAWRRALPNIIFVLLMTGSAVSMLFLY